MGGSPTNVLTDPDFQQLPLAEKHKVLLATDADYRGMPPSEQGKALDHIHYDPQPAVAKASDPGWRNRLADEIQTQTEGGARKLLSNFGAPQSISDVTSGEYGKRITKPGRLSDVIEPYREAGKKSPVGYVPLIGPSSVAASEDLRGGRYGEMAADLATGVAQAAPTAGVASRAGEGISAALRRPTGELRTPVRLASQIAGGVGGHAVAPGIGSYLGYKEGPTLADEIIPDRPAPKPTPFRATRENPHVPLADEIEPRHAEGPSRDEFYERKGEDLMRRGKEQEALDRQAQRNAPKPPKDLKGNKTPFEAPGATSSANPKFKGDLPKIKLKDEIKTEPATPKGKEKLSPYMQRKVGEAEGRHDATKIAEFGADKGVDARVKGRARNKDGTFK